jgi:hypothetical protein
MKTVAAMLAEKNKVSSLSSGTNTSSSKSSCIRGFVRKVRHSLTSDKKPPNLPQVVAPVIKVATPPPQPKSRNDSFTWNIFRNNKAFNNDGYGRGMYYNRKGYSR